MLLGVGQLRDAASHPSFYSRGSHRLGPHVGCTVCCVVFGRHLSVYFLGATEMKACFVDFYRTEMRFDFLTYLDWKPRGYCFLIFNNLISVEENVTCVPDMCNASRGKP